MARSVRTHIVGDSPTPARLMPKHLTKQEFGKRLYALMLGKGWTQSELARRSGVSRDNVSTYIRGVSLPTPLKLQALADAFELPPEELLPNLKEHAIDHDNPSFEMKASVSAPGQVWLRVNRLVSMSTAVKIAELLENDNVLDRSGSGAAAPMQPRED